jgi:hypothetical protein
MIHSELLIRRNEMGKEVTKTKYENNLCFVQVQITPEERNKIKADARKKEMRVYEWWREAAKNMLSRKG